MPDFPKLDIITIDPPRKTQAEKYGGLFYFGLGGLVVVVALLGYFGYGVWSMRDVWTAVYVLNDPKSPEIDRINAGLTLSRDSRVTPRQKWDLILSRVPPDLARYVLAESLRSDVVADAPRAYAYSIARSEGWPDWLRFLLARPMAYAAGEGENLPGEPIKELTNSPDAIISLWAWYTLAVGPEKSPAAIERLKTAADQAGINQELAKLLLQAADFPQPKRSEMLNEAIAWSRTHHPDIVHLWTGWTEQNGRIEQR